MSFTFHRVDSVRPGSVGRSRRFVNAAVRRTAQRDSLKKTVAAAHSVNQRGGPRVGTAVAYRFKLDRPAGKQLVRIVREQIDRARDAAAHPRDPLGKRVHVARTSCKKIRAALRLVRATCPDLWRSENAFFRDAARELAPWREADVMPATFSALLKSPGHRTGARRFHSLRQQLLAHRRAMAAHETDARVLAEFVRQMRAAGRRWAKMKISVETQDIIDGFVATYQWTRQAWRELRPGSSAAEFHEMRKRAKAHMYHCRLLRNTWHGIMCSWRDELSALGDLLGEEHDLAMLDHWLAQHVDATAPTDATAAFRGLIAARLEPLRKESVLLGGRLFVDKPRVLARRLSAWWRTGEKLAPTPEHAH